MLSTIKTSKANKELVSVLTRKLSLGAENVIARIALAYSISKDRKMDPKQVQDSGGKEYSHKVLFGEYAEYYVALICVHYDLHRSSPELSRFIKMHIDDGLELIAKEVDQKTNITGTEFLIDKIEKGLKALN